MKDSKSSSGQGSAQFVAPKDMGFTPWERLKTKRISYLTLPLLAMATVTEIVILSTGWKYQQKVCLPPGMAVTFFSIGPIGATILACELLKLPLAIWTASRHGWQKAFMMAIGLPLICVLTFQLVKDMAVYEMGVALTPASQFLEKANEEEVKIAHLNGELKGVGDKKAEHDRKLAELTAKQAKARADLEESIKRNDAARQDAITLTEYQKKELSEVEARQANIIAQFNADTEQLTKSLADLRTRREAEVAKASKWNAEEARIENAYKTKMVDYANQKAAYDKAKAEYDGANFLKRQLMKEPVTPGVPPEREVNTILKPTLVAELDDQIKAKEAELAAVNNKRRERVAQVDADARRLREQYDTRSVSKREESDKKREELSAALAALAKEEKTEREQFEKEYESAVQTVDGIQAEINASRKKAEGFYEEREAAIRKTQVHRIATTVEIVRGLIKGERPMSIQLSAKQRGDILTDQISMVRIWVYPVLAFIVAFLPTLMVEIGFSTIFEPEQQRPPHRLGFLGRRLHWLYKRAGRQKILRAERLAKEAATQIASREQAMAAANGAADKALMEKEAELQSLREEMSVAAAEHAEVMKQKEEEWVTKLAATTDSLNRTVVEKDALRDLQKSEIERQISMRQNAWSDRLTQLRKELDDQRAAADAERTSLIQEQHKKLMEVSEECKTQVSEARRQAAAAEMAAVEASAKLSHDLKQALDARDLAESQLQQQAEAFNVKLSQAREDTAREVEKALRQEKHRFERQQLEFGKTLRQRDDDLNHQLQQREQELALALETRLAEVQTRLEQEARRRQTELERQFEARALEVDARWKQELQQREEAGQVRLKQREQQLQAQAEIRLGELQAQLEQQSRHREADWERQFEAQAREADGRLKQETQQKEMAFQAKLKQREQELALATDAREAELQKQLAADLRAREEEWERQAEARVRAAEIRLSQELQQREELSLSKSRQRDQQWQAKLDAARAELQAQTEMLRRRDLETDAAMRDLDARLRKEMQQKEEASLARVEQREQELIGQLTGQAEARQKAAQALWEAEADKRARAAIEPFKLQLARAERERDEAKQSAFENARQAQNLEKQLTEASSFLNGWRNGGKNAVGAS
jgi:hypothetical protein